MKLTSAGSTNIAMAPPARTTPENSLIIADHRRVVIGRMSRRRWAPERSNLSCGPTISRCVMALPSARPYCSCSPNVAGPVGGAGGAALDVAGAAVECEYGIGGSNPDGAACSAGGGGVDPTAY